MNEPITAIYQYFDLLYATQVIDGSIHYVQIPRGMCKLGEIEDYVQRHHAAGLPSYTEHWSH
jgi:hypothetical protein